MPQNKDWKNNEKKVVSKVKKKICKLNRNQIDNI